MEDSISGMNPGCMAHIESADRNEPPARMPIALIGADNVADAANQSPELCSRRIKE
jgi:hypothetical protein